MKWIGIIALLIPALMSTAYADNNPYNQNGQDGQNNYPPGQNNYPPSGSECPAGQSGCTSDQNPNNHSHEMEVKQATQDALSALNQCQLKDNKTQGNSAFSGGFPDAN